MSDFESIKNYFLNIDFDIVDDSELLNNVYQEIKGYEERLILNLESVINFELLIKKSNISQIEKLCKSINIHFLALKKTGSKFLEVVYTAISEIKEFQKKDLYKSCFQPIADNFCELCVDKNGTHVVRKFFLCFCKNFKDEILKILENEISIDCLITIVEYLRIQYSKSIMRAIIRKFYKQENICNKLYTYIFENLIKISDEKSLEISFEIIKPSFSDYVNDKFGVFLILALIKKYPKKNDFYFSYCKAEMKNTNVLLKVTENYCKLQDFKKVEEIFFDFYKLKNNIFYGLLLNNTDSPDTKYINLIKLLMEYNLFKVNEDFVKFFKQEWIYRKFGINLLIGFFEGGANEKLKSDFSRTLKGLNGLNKKRDGKRIVSFVKSYKKINF